MIDLTKIEKPFGLLDKETQDALLAHEGPIEGFDGNGWIVKDLPTWIASYTYRAAHQPVRGEVVMFGQPSYGPNWIFGEHDDDDTHRITLPTLDGKLPPGTYTGPDGATVKIEVL